MVNCAPSIASTVNAALMPTLNPNFASVKSEPTVSDSQTEQPTQPLIEHLLELRRRLNGKEGELSGKKLERFNEKIASGKQL